MTEVTAKSKLRRYLMTCIVLVAGLGCSVAIYLTAEVAPDDPFAEFEKSRKYAYELERMGGKAALVANDLNNWFFGLWHGESLAFTVAFITIIVSAVYYFASSDVKADEDNGTHSETTGEQNGQK